MAPDALSILAKPGLDHALVEVIAKESTARHRTPIDFLFPVSHFDGS